MKCQALNLPFSIIWIFLHIHSFTNWKRKICLSAIKIHSSVWFSLVGHFAILCLLTNTVSTCRFLYKTYRFRSELKRYCIFILVTKLFGINLLWWFFRILIHRSRIKWEKISLFDSKKFSKFNNSTKSYSRLQYYI